MKTVPSIEKRYNAALAQAEKKLASLDVIRRRSIDVRGGLRGWIFEQTIRTCLEEEFEKRGLAPRIKEQQSIGGKAKVDLLIDSIALEVKVSGFYSDVGPRYRKYRRRAEAKGWEYFYLTLEESYGPNIKSARRVFGRNRAFFLDQKGSWARFVSAVIEALK